jgi:hypothetical protein
MNFQSITKLREVQIIFKCADVSGRGKRCRSWLMHCATSRKIAGSIPDGVIGIFHSGRIMAPWGGLSL